VAQTKKLLVNFDRKNPKRSSSDFLIPFPQDGCVYFRGLRSGRERGEGLLVYIGESITEEELVSRLAELGKVDFDHARLLEMCRQYLTNLQELRIGNIVSWLTPVAANSNLNVLRIRPRAWIATWNDRGKRHD
jgi:hypothetical protein